MEGSTMDYYNKLLQAIENSSDFAELNKILTRHYTKISANLSAILFNTYQNTNNFDDSSLKILFALSYTHIEGDIKENWKQIIFRKMKFDFYKELMIINESSEKIFSLYCEDITDESTTSEDIHFRAFLSYHFDFPAISFGQYIKILKLFNPVLSKEISGYKNLDDLLRFILDMVLLKRPDNYQELEEEGVMFFNRGIILKEDILRIIEKSNLTKECMKDLFIDSESLTNSYFITNINKEMVGKIGVDYGKYFYIPQSPFILNNFFQLVLKSKVVNEKKKGDILEEYVQELLMKFFPKETVFHEIYDQEGFEQDFIIVHKDVIYSIECKAKNFHEVFRNKESAMTRLTHRFNSSIREGYEQCRRVEKRLLIEQSDYYNSDNPKSRKSILSISKPEKYRLKKIIILLDDFQNLAESSQEILQDNDCWCVNVFAFEKILWYLDKNKKNKIEILEDYIDFRLKSRKITTSVNSDELSHFGLFISKTYRFPSGFFDKDIGISLHLKNSFSQFSEEFDIQTFKEELDKLFDYSVKVV